MMATPFSTRYSTKAIKISPFVYLNINQFLL